MSKNSGKGLGWGMREKTDLLVAQRKLSLPPGYTLEQGESRLHPEPVIWRH